MFTVLIIVLLMLFIFRPLPATYAQRDMVLWIVVILVVLWALGFFGGFYPGAYHIGRVCP